MSRLITLDDPARASLAEAGDALAAHGFDPDDPESLDHAARWLRRLGNDPDFLGDILIDQLARRHRDDGDAAGYGPQVIALAPARGDVFIRANIWPAPDDAMVAGGGEAAFVYGLAHDHNFSFLTLGYFGPGYASEDYEFDYAAVAGARGEAVPSLRPAGITRLTPGTMLHYRRHVDVHAQRPAEALSVSLNFLHVDPAQNWFDQYAFDLAGSQVSAIVSPLANEALLRVAVGMGSGEALDLAHRYARRHPSDRMRLVAWDALASREAEPALRDALWREAEAAGSRLVAIEARARRAELAA